MYEGKVTVNNEIGLHARAASAFIQEAVKFKSDISVIKNDQTYNAKSIMSILSMSAKKGQELWIKAVGEDDKQAVESLIRLVKSELSEY